MVTQAKLTVAPVRERGLKYRCWCFCVLHFGRSREGAWIEIEKAVNAPDEESCRSREGAWIEICLFI